MSLEELRRKIDEADTRIVKLLAERIRIAEAIGREKNKQGKRIEDVEREKGVLENVSRIAREENINEQDIESIYAQIVTLSKSVQGIAVAFQGEIGAFGEEAAFQFFGASIQVKPCESLDNVFKFVEQGDVQYGVVPIENSLEGSISRVYDLLLDSSLKVFGETELRVSHCLIANPGTQLGSIRRVYSHPHNFTKFFILSKHDSPPTRNDKTSIVFSVKHRPGTLYTFLSKLAAQNINLTKIESRPTRQKPWEYNFYLDFEGHREDAIPREVMESLEQETLFLKVLGSYPKAR
jgi:chorismate mutase